MHLYITVDQVKQKIQGKVNLQNWNIPSSSPDYWDDQSNGAVLTDAEIENFIYESQAEVMMDLSQLYAIPIQEKDGNTDLATFKEPITKQILTSLFVYRASIYCLMGIYGQVNATDEERMGYIHQLAELYEMQKTKALERWDNGGGFKYPALKGLKLSLVYTTRQNRPTLQTVRGSSTFDPALKVDQAIASVNNPEKYWFRWGGYSEDGIPIFVPPRGR